MRGGGYYLDDGPGENPPPNLDAIPDASPKAEPLHSFANKPYSVLGRDYVPMREVAPYQAHGLASWYGRRYHGQKTSSGETYDMYSMTAAHATLPIPSYVRVTNPDSRKSVVLRINDRGPFHSDRIIDLSYVAAWKLGLIGSGSGLVDIESILPGQTAPTLGTNAAPTAPGASAAEGPADLRLPQIGDAHGVWLQLGAFGNRDNADALKSKMEKQLGSLADKLTVQASGNVYRLQLGPWASPDEARQVAVRLAENPEIKPVVVQR